MSLESVRKYFATHAPDIDVLVTEASSATVAEAAAAHGVEPAQIAKTLSLRVGGRTFLVVTGGLARLDNRKVKDTFGGKASMLEAAEVASLTGHPIGGVCPFGLATPLPGYLDRSLQAFDHVYPAAGSLNTSVEVTPERLFELVGERWVEVCRLPE